MKFIYKIKKLRFWGNFLQKPLKIIFWYGCWPKTTQQLMKHDEQVPTNDEKAKKTIRKLTKHLKWKTKATKRTNA